MRRRAQHGAVGAGLDQTGPAARPAPERVEEAVAATRLKTPCAEWSANQLTDAGLSAPTDADWADYPGLAFGSLVALAAFAAITRLPGRRQLPYTD
jgi:hypothetical protein